MTPTTSTDRSVLQRVGAPGLRAVSTNHHAAREVFQKIADNIARIMQGQSGATRKLLAALASGGHVLLEDFPGTGKTTLAKRRKESAHLRCNFSPMRGRE